MAYSAWSVVAFEQPSTTKWNILGLNDAYFNDQITLLTTLAAAYSLQGGYFTRTISGNDLVVAVKANSGNDPSATEPVKVKIGNAIRSITAALSITIPASVGQFGAGAASFATFQIDYFVYLCWKAASSTVVLGVSRLPCANTYAEFNATSTNDHYGAFSSTPASSDQVVVIGRFNATMSASASYNWSIPATDLIIPFPIYRTQILTYSPQFTGFSANPSGGVYKYFFDYKICKVSQRMPNSGTSNDTVMTTTAPITSETRASDIAFALTCDVIDNGAVAGLSRCQIGSNAAVIDFFKGDGNAWTGSSTKRASIESFLEYVF